MRYQELLRRRGSDGDKQALLERLREDKVPPTWAQRLGLWLERVWPQVRIPAYATSFALMLAAVTSVTVFYTQAPIAAPEIQDMEFGGNAVVIESTSDPATLIWLSEPEEEPADDADEPEEGEEF